MGLKSKTKGKTGEREAAAEIARLFGVSARRGVQYQGGQGSPDIVTDLAGVHFEVKRCEALSIYGAMRQAIEDSRGSEKIPLVLHRRNNAAWLAIVRLDDLPSLAEQLAPTIADSRHPGPNATQTVSA
jgi:hypothetical protein